MFIQQCFSFIRVVSICCWFVFREVWYNQSLSWSDTTVSLRLGVSGPVWDEPEPNPCWTELTTLAAEREQNPCSWFQKSGGATESRSLFSNRTSMSFLMHLITTCCTSLNRKNERSGLSVSCFSSYENKMRFLILFSVYKISRTATLGPKRTDRMKSWDK